MIKSAFKIFKVFRYVSKKNCSNISDKEFFIDLAKFQIQHSKEKDDELNYSKLIDRINESGETSKNVTDLQNDTVLNNDTENILNQIEDIELDKGAISIEETANFDISKYDTENISNQIENIELDKDTISIVESANLGTSNLSGNVVKFLQNKISHIPLNELINNPSEVYNVGPLIKNNETMTNFLQLGVDLFRLENTKGGSNILVRLHWKNDVLPMISLLEGELPFTQTQIARIFSFNPQIFRTPFIEIQEVFNYFKGRNMLPSDITHIVSERPYILRMKNVEISKKLTELEEMIALSTDEMNVILLTVPKVVDEQIIKLKSALVQLHKIMGFKKEETKAIIKKSPKLFIRDKECVAKNFVFLHRSLNMPYEDIVKYAPALAASPSMLENRVKFLIRLNRYQTDPTKELFTPLGSIIEGDEQQFCKNVAHTSVSDFRKFLKTL